MVLPAIRMLTLASSLLIAAIVPSATPAMAASEGPLASAFTRAAAASDVPRDLLVSLAYSETHLDGHRGLPSSSGGYGVMHLVSNPVTHTLEKASELTGTSTKTLRENDQANILGGASLLRFYADELGLAEDDRDDVGKWYSSVAKYGNASSPEVARLYADTVYTLLEEGFRISAAGGEVISVAPRDVSPDRGDYGRVRDLDSDFHATSDDYPAAHWVPASSNSWRAANRPSSSAIDRIVIHVAQGSYAGTISWFQNPNRPSDRLTSSHYVVRSFDGDITQMVREKDIATHVYNWNNRSIGIEHEGFVDNPSWFTDSMYRASAALTRNIAGRYGIPKDRAHIIAHHEVPGNDHTDPGPHWDWTRYMQYVNEGSTSTVRRVGVLGGGALTVKEGAVNAPWGQTQLRGVASFELEGDRIGVLTTSGDLWVKQGGLTAPWTTLPQLRNVKAFDLDGVRIGALQNTGELWVKEGGLDAGWGGRQMADVKAFQLDGNRIGALQNSGDLWVKDGGTNALWGLRQTGDVRAFELDGARIGALHTGGELWVKEGGLDAGWGDRQMADVKAFQLDGNRIGVVQNSGDLWVKDGGTNALWGLRQTGDVRAFELEGARIGALHTGGELWVKEGGLDAGWGERQMADVKAFDLDGDRIGVLQNSGVLWIKEGATNATWSDPLTSATTEAFQLHSWN
jgi:N-acetylmuramoyl-L-alanine amidase